MCEYQDCENPAEFLDAMDSQICQECMEREINEGDASPEDFERFRMIV